MGCTSLMRDQGNRWGVPCAVLAVMAAGCTAAGQTQAPLTLADALQTTLERHPQLGIQEQQVISQRGALQQASGQFDLLLSGDALQGHTFRALTGFEEFQYSQYDNFNFNSATTNTSQIDFAGTKEFRNGIIVNPSITDSRVTDNLTNRQGINAGKIQVAATLPLLRGRRSTVVDAQEAASAKQLKAAQFEVNETISGLLATVASSYWTAVAAGKQLEVLRESESSAKALTESVRSLIEADRIPRTDINEAEANLAVRESNRLVGEQRLVEARQQLAIDMGLDATEMSALPEISAGFPEEVAPEDIPTDSKSIGLYIQLALERKPELQALKQREEASQRIAGASRDALRPDLSVKVATGVTGLYEGTRIDQYVTAPVHAIRGEDITAGITYRFAPGRDAAAGALEQANAAARQTDLQYQDLARRTAAAVAPALLGFRSQALQLRRMREAVQLYRNSVDAEHEKLRMGAGNVMNTISVEDRLTGSLASEVQAQLGYLQALVRLRVATSTIVAPDQQTGFVDADLFTTPPSLPAEAKAGASQ
jgi:outer membrane protein TolC